MSGRCNELATYLGVAVDCCSSCHDENEDECEVVTEDAGMFFVCCKMAALARVGPRRGPPNEEIEGLIDAAKEKQMHALPSMIAKANCRGTTADGKPCFKKPIVVKLYASFFHCGWDVSVQDCPYLTGGHGQRCTASHPGHEKPGDGVACALVGHTSMPGAMVTDDDPNEKDE
jgi:hypothetical protein